MSLYSQLDRLASDLEAVKSQLHAVANTNQLQRSSVEAGSLDFNDEDGNLKAIIGLQHDGATTVNVVNGPKPATPAGITAGVDNGRIILRWDGTFAGDLIAPTDWARTEIYAQEGSFVVPTPENARGSFVSAAGGELTIGVKRGTWTVCVAAWSQAGRQSEMSVPITVEVPGFGDLVQEAIDAAEALIEEARTALEAGQAELTDKLGGLTTDITDLGYDIDQVQLAQTQLTEDVATAITSANSKNTITRSTENPPASYTGRVDDLWWKMTSMAAAGRVLAQYRWTGTEWFEEKIDSAVLAYVDAAKITTGFLDVATLIRAAAITVDKLLIGSERNLIPNGDLSTGTAAGWPSSVTYSATGGPNNAPYVTFPKGNGYAYDPFDGTRFRVTPGETLVFETWVKADIPESWLYVTIQDQTGPSTSTSGRLTHWTGVEGHSPSSQGPVAAFIVPAEWEKLVSRIVVPAGVESVVVQAFYLNHTSGTVRDAAVSFSGMKLYKPVGGTLIEPGGIQTPHLAADVLDVKNFTAGTGEMNEAVIAKLFSDVVVARMAQAQEFIGENAILTGAITAPKITASEELTAKIAEFLSVRAEMIEADAIDGMVVRGLTLIAGNDRHRLDDGGYAIFDEDGNRRTYLSPEGSSFKGEVEAESLVVNGGAELRGTTNTLAQGGKLTIAAGVTDPTAPPVVQPYWESIEFVPPSDASPVGLAFDGTHYWTAEAWPGVGAAWKIDAAAGAAERVLLPALWGRLFGVTCIGSELFWLTLSGHISKVIVTDLNLTKKREFEFEDIGFSPTNPLTYNPGIGNDGTNVLIAHCSDGGVLYLRTYNPSTGAKTATVELEGFKNDVTGAFRGSADFGLNRTVVSRPTPYQLRVGGTDLAYDGSLSWDGPPGEKVSGFCWTGERFASIGSDGKITEYADINTGDGSGDWWATYYWYTDVDQDSIIESTDYRSRMAPPKRFIWPRRAGLKILGQPLPAGVEALGPALAKKTSAPVRTDFSGPGWQVDSGKPSARYLTLPTDWTIYASPSADNTYPTAVPASIESASGTLQFKGDGSGRWGPLTFNTDGSMSGINKTAAGRVIMSPTSESERINAYVTFPVGRFSEAPAVTATADSVVPERVQGIGTSSPSATGFRLYFMRTTVADTGVTWIAMEMD